MSLPEDLLYTAEHEWVRVTGDEAVVGITAFAQDQLGDVVHVDLPAVGAKIAAGDPFGEVESVKTVSDLFSPLTGEVNAINEALAEHPELVNESPYDGGWLLRIRTTNEEELGEMLDAAGYQAHIAQT